MGTAGPGRPGRLRDCGHSSIHGPKRTLGDTDSKLLHVGYRHALAVRHLNHLTQPILEKQTSSRAASLGLLAATSPSKFRASSHEIGVLGPESTP